MKKNITIRVTCTYDVWLEREVSEEVYNQLCDIYDNHNGEISDGELHNHEALDWLGCNISEADALNWKYEIDEMEEI
ncbi:MAG: hypothetical protein NC248_12290 [Bacteroides sp.]|nr:hypothetical protein [Bacteroides sp.]MCM1391107.1 hypothetical protein [Bacteroides sp.]